MNFLPNLVKGASYNRLLYAAKFLKPPGKYKRAEMREKPRVLTGPFENPVRRLVRMKEKLGKFYELPPPRVIPVAKPSFNKFLATIEGVPTVKPAVLEARLAFLLSEQAKFQQLSAKLRPGLTPYQAESIMWERQMIDLRKIYRAQYLQKLAEVTEKERKKQIEAYLKDKEERRKARELVMQRMMESRKRAAVLKDRLRIERKVTQMMNTSRSSKKKISNLYWLAKLQKSSNSLMSFNEKTMKHPSPTVDEEDKKQFFSRNLSAPEILRLLGHNVETPKSIKKKIRTGSAEDERFFFSVLQDSYKFLNEDEPQFERRKDSLFESMGDHESSPSSTVSSSAASSFSSSPDSPSSPASKPPSSTPSSSTPPTRRTPRGRRTYSRAHATYEGFSEEEKISLLNEKIRLLNEWIEDDESSRGSDSSRIEKKMGGGVSSSQRATYLQLREQLEAVRQACLDSQSSTVGGSEASVEDESRDDGPPEVLSSVLTK